AFTYRDSVRLAAGGPADRSLPIRVRYHGRIRVRGNGSGLGSVFHTPTTWSDASRIVRFACGALAGVSRARRFDLGVGAVFGDVGLALVGGGRGHRRDGRGGGWCTGVEM